MLIYSYLSLSSSSLLLLLLLFAVIPEESFSLILSLLVCPFEVFVLNSSENDCL